MTISSYSSVALDRVVDGDTVWLYVDLGFNVRIALDFRLYGINAPELEGVQKPAGLASKAEVERLLGLGTLRIDVYGIDKYGRWLAVIFVKQADGTELNINQTLVTEGYAKPYFGEGPKPV